DDFDYDVALDFGFVGIGQAGCRIAESFYNLGYRRVAVIDGVKTDLDAINEEIPKLYLATEGSGKDLDVALKSIAGKEQDIWDLFKKGLGEPDYIIICTSLGGGTGAGTCVRISEIAHEYMSTTDRPPRVGVIGAMPLRSEGGKASINSKKTFAKIKSKNLSPIILIDNQRINDLFRVGVGAIFQKCNEQIAQLLHVFNKLAAQDK